MSRKRTYDQTFRMEAVSLVNTSNKSIAAVARELDIPPQTLTRWVSMYGNEGSDAFVGSGNLSSEKQEERDLQKQIRDLEEENRILKKAMRIFANEQK